MKTNSLRARSNLWTWSAAIHRILAPQIVRHEEGEEGTHTLVLALRGHVAVVPGGAELGQVDGEDLVDVNELARLSEGKELALEKRP
jgi:hypothetical protein